MFIQFCSWFLHLASHNCCTGSLSLTFFVFFFCPQKETALTRERNISVFVFFLSFFFCPQKETALTRVRNISVFVFFLSFFFCPQKETALTRVRNTVGRSHADGKGMWSSPPHRFFVVVSHIGVGVRVRVGLVFELGLG
jgi:hypothetical protein